MLESMSSADLAEWRAYEMTNGPIGDQYEHETLAAIHEQLQRVVAAIIAQNVKDEDDIPEVIRYPRPNELFQFEDNDQEE